MLRLVVFFLFSSFFFANFFTIAWGFIDVRPDSPLVPAIKYITTKTSIKDSDNYAFSPDDPITQGVFYQILLEETGFRPAINIADIFLPFYQQAIKQNILNSSLFDKNSSITRLDALDKIFQIKKERHASSFSKNFIQRVDFWPLTPRFSVIEHANKLQVITDNELRFFDPYQPATREEIITWLYRYHLVRIDRDKKIFRKMPPKIHIIQKSSVSSSDIDQVIDQISNKFKFYDQLPKNFRENITENTIKHLVENLEDRYSNYIPATDSKKFKENISGDFQGIGAYVDMINNEFVITAPIENSPAEKAGLRPGDVVLSVDGQDIHGLDVQESIRLIRGLSGTEVELTIRRNDSILKIIVIRAEVQVPVVNTIFEKNVPIIKIFQFNDHTARRLREDLQEIVLPKNPKKIIFDFRNNPGGLLTSAVDIAEIFADIDVKLVSIEYRKRTREYVSRKKGLLSYFPGKIIILQNAGTASASEIVIGFLEDHKDPLIFGTKSLGKGTVQEVIPLGSGGNLQLTVARWLTPNGRWIDKVGIIPDIEIEDDPETKIDEVIQAAVNHTFRH